MTTWHAFRPLTGNIFGEIKLPRKGINRLYTEAITGEINFAPDEPHLMGCRNLDIEYKVQLKYVEISRPYSLFRVEMEALHFYLKHELYLPSPIKK